VFSRDESILGILMRPVGSVGSHDDDDDADDDEIAYFTMR